MTFESFPPSLKRRELDANGCLLGCLRPCSLVEEDSCFGGFRCFRHQVDVADRTTQTSPEASHLQELVTPKRADNIKMNHVV